MVKQLIVVITGLVLFMGCSMSKSSTQVVNLVRNYNEEGRLVSEQRQAIKQRAHSVNVRDGVDIQEARALAEGYILDYRPNMLAGNMMMMERPQEWQAHCLFLNESVILHIDKQTGVITEETVMPYKPLTIKTTF